MEQACQQKLYSLVDFVKNRTASFGKVQDKCAVALLLNEKMLNYV